MTTQIFVKTLTGKTVTLDVTGSMKVLEVKEIAGELVNIPANMLRIILSGKALADDLTMDHYNYTRSGAVFHLVLHLRSNHMGPPKSARSALEYR